MTSLIGCTRTLSSVARRLNNIRHIMTAKPASAPSDLPFREIRIPVPWGHIAAKEWGGPNSVDGEASVPLIAVHGYMDNCASFDPVVPLMAWPGMHLVAFDLPGHGLSSHLPEGTFYHPLDYVGHLRRVVRHLGFKRVSLLTHSMGVAIGSAYCAFFPEEVSKLVTLDLLRIVTLSNHLAPSFAARRLDQLIDHDNLKKPRRVVLTMDGMVAMWMAATKGMLNEKSARILLERCTVEAEDGMVELSSDRRLNISVPLYTDEQVLLLLRRLRCPTLAVVPRGGITSSKRWDHLMDGNFSENVYLEAYRSGCSSFEVAVVDGAHHVHMDSPEIVAPLLRSFFLS